MLSRVRLACGAVAVAVTGISYLTCFGVAQADGAPVLQLKVGASGMWTSSPPAVFNIKHLEPGSTTSSDVQVRDAGSSSGSLTLQADDVVESGGTIGASGPYDCDTPNGFADQLVIDVEQVVAGTQSPMFKGSLCALQADSASLDPAQLQPGAEVDYVVSAYLPGSAGNDLQGASASWSLSWRITSDSGDSSAVTTQVLGEKTSRSSGHGVLAFTGFNALSWAAAGLLVLLFGVFLVLARSGRRATMASSRN